MRPVEKFSRVVASMFLIFFIECSASDVYFISTADSGELAEQDVSIASTPVPCTHCKNLSFTDATFGKPITITEAKFVCANLLYGTKAYCKIKARIWPEIDVVIKLPTRSNWNGKMLYIGGGGWDGVIPNLSNGVARGYATAGSNGGHTSSVAYLGEAGIFDGTAFDMSDPENTDVPQKLEDFSHRAAYEGSVLAKKIIRAYYGRDSKYAYWMGCSNGGRGAMMMAQRHPEVFDGYIAGAPHFTYTGTTLRGLWDSQVSSGCLNGTCDAAAAFIPQSYYTDVFTYLGYALPKLNALNKKVYEKCDCGGQYDSVAGDGIIDQPDKCGFDPMADLLSVACPDDVDNPDCFTSGQRQALKKIYDGMQAQGVSIPGMGEGRFAGTPVGAEGFLFLGWMGSIVPMPPQIWPFSPEGIGDMLCAPFFQFLSYNLEWQEGPDWDWTTFNFNLDPPNIADSGIMEMIDATSGDLHSVREKGAKIIHYHGWADVLVTPLYSIDYYDNVLTPEMGNVDDFYRLFLVPGMSHCTSGVGCNEIDWLSSLEDWVEKGVAPDRMIGKRPANYLMGWKKKRTRPICPYPKNAKYKGTGSIDDADNFYCD
ncbi:MAG: tannase/feruloyl esterase family alpha/beta hydrolase [Proteobacteria bacterium]|nr:tannase/feruloyl esterase family alpha/beta hydrolase [Pseudomonadota bacterium]